LIARRRVVLVGFGLAALAALAGRTLVAQPQKIAPPAQAGRPPKMAVPPGLAAPPSIGAVVVTPSPEPWYTVFATGEVVGYIEPCG